MFKNLKEIIISAKNNIGFYKNRIDSTIASIEDENEILNHFYNLPIVRKETIRKDYKSFIHDDLIKIKEIDDIININRNYAKEYTYKLPFTTIICELTSGSSGTPFVSIKSIDERINLGKKLWQLRNNFSPIIQKYFFNIDHSGVEGKTYAFPFEIEKNGFIRTKKEVEYLKDSSYKWWHCNSSKVNLYCEYSKQHNLEFRNLEVIENSGSFITEEERKNFISTFNCKVSNSYACREIWSIAYDCVDNYLHINEEHVLFELVNDNDEIIYEANHPGRVVITSLKQKIMPFIRYFLGDYAYYIDGNCHCGCNHKRIALLPGRYLIDGTNLYGKQVFRVIVVRMNLRDGITNYSNISVKQIDLNNMIVNIKGNQEAKEKIEAAFMFQAKKYFNDKFNFHFTYYDNVEPKDIFVSMNDSSKKK